MNCSTCQSAMNYVPTNAQWFCNRCADWRQGPAPQTPPVVVESAQPVTGGGRHSRLEGGLDLLDLLVFGAPILFLIAGVVTIALGHMMIGLVIVGCGAVALFGF